MFWNLEIKVENRSHRVSSDHLSYVNTWNSIEIWKVPTILFLRLTTEFPVDSCAQVLSTFDIFFLPLNSQWKPLFHAKLFLSCFEVLWRETTSEKGAETSSSSLEYNSSTPFIAEGWPSLPLALLLCFIPNKYSPTFVLCCIATSFFMTVWHKEERLVLIR